jgi:hypothetical protein
MSDRATKVLRGFTSLDQDDQKVVVDEINKYLKFDLKRKILQEDFYKKAAARIMTGSIAPQRCDCCGK